MEDSHTFPGEAMTPRCAECGIALCYDIGMDEYEENKEFWDTWKCSDCNPEYKGAYQKFKNKK